MSHLATWTPGQWVVTGLGVAIILFGLVTALFGARFARRHAIKQGRVDADGDPWYDDGNSPAATVRGGLIAVGFGALYTFWNLHNGGVI